MNELVFEAAKRKESAKDARAKGLIPAIVYGKNFDNIKLVLNPFQFRHLYKEAGSSNIVDLKVGEENVKTLIHDVQEDPVNSQVLHVDFLKINMKEKYNIKSQSPGKLSAKSLKENCF